MMRNLRLLQALLLTSTAVIHVSSQTCGCNQINDWKELRTLIMRETWKDRVDAHIQKDIPLCPFNITKFHDKDTEHWSEIVYIESAAHIYCMKNNPTDECTITVTGDKCEKNKNCGRQLFKISADDVWLQGINIKEAKDVVVNIDRNQQNAKLIDMTFIDGRVPDRDDAKSAGVVLGEFGSNVQILGSVFEENRATAVYTRGSLILHDSYFIGNRGTKFFQRGGAIFSKNETSISKSSFLFNWATEGGYSLYSSHEDAILDAGGNCFKSLGDWGCQGIQTIDKCFEFAGEDTKCPMTEKALAYMSKQKEE